MVINLNAFILLSFALVVKKLNVSWFKLEVNELSFILSSSKNSVMFEHLLSFYIFRVDWVIPEPEPEFVGTRTCG